MSFRKAIISFIKGCVYTAPDDDPLPIGHWTKYFKTIIGSEVLKQFLAIGDKFFYFLYNDLWIFLG